METVLAQTLAPESRMQLWTGRVLTGLVATFLLVDAVAKLVPLEPVIEGTQKLGYPVDVIRPLGVVLAVSTVLHLVRRTELLGAVLLTAYLGGATATHVRTGTPFAFAVGMGVIVWVAYGLRSPRIRALFLGTV
jgi:hypothetical protein